MALVLLPGGSDVAGKAVKVILPLAGEVLFQLQKFCVRKKYIFISAISGGGLPYSVTVEIERFKVEENGLYHIHGLILVERDGQKKMVIGNKGEKIKTIGTEARLDMERLFQNKVHLELWVKVKSGWADDERALRSLGYGDD